MTSHRIAAAALAVNNEGKNRGHIRNAVVITIDDYFMDIGIPGFRTIVCEQVVSVAQEDVNVGG